MTSYITKRELTIAKKRRKVLSYYTTTTFCVSSEPSIGFVKSRLVSFPTSSEGGARMTAKDALIV